MFNGRVDGDLAVARAFGDFNYKRRKDLPPEAQEVSCEPEVLIRERHMNDSFLLFACDGIWDVWNDMDEVREVLTDLMVVMCERDNV